MTATTVRAALGSLLAGDAAQPFVTYLGADGARTELSVRTYENNVAKAANLLRDDADVSADSLVAVRLPLHWQVSVWLGACAMTGCTAWLDGDPGDPRVEVALLGPSTLEPARAPLTLASALHPFGLPFTVPLPAGVLDAALEVRVHGDRFTAYDDVTGGSSWLRIGDRAWTQSAALEDAAGLAASLGLTSGGRLLCTRALDEVSALALLAVPLAVGGSVVLLDATSADGSLLDDAGIAAVADRERCDAVLR
jgi:uncharacterized protein (TIGR03089 family)